MSEDFQQIDDQRLAPFRPLCRAIIEAFATEACAFWHRMLLTGGRSPEQDLPLVEGMWAGARGFSWPGMQGGFWKRAISPTGPTRRLLNELDQLREEAGISISQIEALFSEVKSEYVYELYEQSRLERSSSARVIDQQRRQVEADAASLEQKRIEAERLDTERENARREEVRLEAQRQENQAGTEEDKRGGDGDEESAVARVGNSMAGFASQRAPQQQMQQQGSPIEVALHAERSKLEARRVRLESDPVDAAVYCQPSVLPSQTFLIQVLLFLPEQQNEANKLANSVDLGSTLRSKYSLPLDVEVGTRVHVQIESSLLTIEQPEAIVIWRGYATGATLEATVPTDITEPQIMIRVRLTIDGLPVGTMRFQLKVAAHGEARSNEELQPIEGVRYRKAFVSYSSEDRDEVLRRVQGIKSIGLSVFQDVLELGPGDRWQKQLYREIGNCDLFLLFWSRSAKASKWVAKEIAYAVRCKKKDDNNPPDIRPIWLDEPPLPKPPRSIRHLHFDDPIRAHIWVATAAKSRRSRVHPNVKN